MRKQQFEEESYLPSISIQFQFHSFDIKWVNSNLCKSLICPQFQINFNFIQSILNEKAAICASVLFALNFNSPRESILWIWKEHRLNSVCTTSIIQLQLTWFGWKRKKYNLKQITLPNLLVSAIQTFGCKLL